MNETVLIKIALICVIVGLPALYILADQITVDATTLDKINGLPQGSTVKITGEVVVVEKYGGISKITVMDTIEIVVFEDVDVQVGDDIEIYGNLDEYNGKEQIIAEEIVVT